MATTIAKQYTRLITLWPKDALRPNLPFTRAIEHRGAAFGVKIISPAPEGSPSKVDSKTSESASASAASPASASSSSLRPPPDARLEQAQVNALFSLLENRYSKKYPLSAEALQPESMPDHYTKLMEEIEKAPKKTWWQAKVDEWKMKIRWS